MIFSVIIPAYQCQNTIRNAVESICASGLKDYEIIIVDDGSSDKTPKICNDLAFEYHHIKYIRQENRGVSMARNLGIEYASGQYVLFFDADDLVDRGAMTGIVKIIKVYEPDLLIFGLSFDYYRKENLYRRDLAVYPKEGLMTPVQWGTELSLLYDYNVLMPVWNKVYKKSLMGSQVRFAPDYFVMEDFLFVLDFLKYCRNIYCLSKPVYRYRQSEKEGHAHYRMKKITSLNTFMIPFEDAMTVLKEQNAYVKGERRILNEMYHMLLEQKLFKADIKSVKGLAKAYKAGPYCRLFEETHDTCASDFCVHRRKSGAKTSRRRHSHWWLGVNKYRRIHWYMAHEKYIRVWCLYKYIQIRHQIAVRIKSLRYLRIGFWRSPQKSDA